MTVIPPVAYVPVSGPPTDGMVEFEMRRVEDGRLALVAYTALDRLLDGCGATQPWVLVETAKLAELQSAAGWDAVAWDRRLPDDVRRPSQDQVATAVGGSDA